jgi:hypothetical protein
MVRCPGRRQDSAPPFQPPGLTIFRRRFAKFWRPSSTSPLTRAARSRIVGGVMLH